MLIAQKQEQEQLKQTFQNKYTDNDFVFDNGFGQNAEPRYFSEIFANLLKQLKIEGVTPHSMRHIFASNLRLAGVSAKELQELVGHKDYAFIYNNYVHLFEKSQHEAMDKIEATMNEILK